jgi:heat shock protein HtpX
VQARNIYEQQASNRRATVLVMVVFTLLVAALGFGFDFIFLDTSVPVATVVALMAGAMSSLWSLRSGAAAVLRSAGAAPVSTSDQRYQQLRNVTEEMAIASGLPVPALHVIPDPDPNAFATGRDPDHAHVAVTEGLLQQLDRSELQAVVAHEMSHIRNFDIRLLTVVAALIGAVMLLSELGLRSFRFGGGRNRSMMGGGAVILVLWLAGLVLAPFVARILALAVSRQREYLADASAAELTRNPGALASALQKIDEAVAPTRRIKQGTAHLCIADPIGRTVNAKEGLLADLFATHPPIQKRIAILREMSYQHA